MEFNPRLTHMLKRITKWIFHLVLVALVLLFFILLFFTLQSNHREIKTVTEAAPSTGEFVNVNGTKIFLQQAGPKSGQPVVLIHGTGSWSEIWRETIVSLAEAGFHAIALDVPPFGYSEKPRGSEEYSPQNQAKRILGVLDALKIRHAIFVGHSVGARPTIEAALEDGNKFDALILVDPALGFQTDPLETPHFVQNDPSWLVRTFFSIKPLERAVFSTTATNPLFGKRLFSSFVSNKDAVTPERLKTLQEPLVVKDSTRAYGDWLEYLLISKDDSLASDFNNFKNLKMPVSIVWGSTDTVTPLWQGEALAQMIPNSKLNIIEGVGHIPYIENVKEFNSVLIGILKKYDHK